MLYTILNRTNLKFVQIDLQRVIEQNIPERIFDDIQKANEYLVRIRELIDYWYTPEENCEYYKRLKEADLEVVILNVFSFRDEEE